MTLVSQVPGRAGAAPVTTFVEHDHRLAELRLLAKHLFAGKHLAVFETGQRFGLRQPALPRQAIGNGTGREHDFIGAELGNVLLVHG